MTDNVQLALIATIAPTVASIVGLITSILNHGKITTMNENVNAISAQVNDSAVKAQEIHDSIKGSTK